MANRRDRIKKYKHKKKLARDLQHQHRCKYPDIVVKEGNSPVEFCEFVKKGVGQIDFEQPRQFSKWARSFFQSVKQHGSQAILEEYQIWDSGIDKGGSVNISQHAKSTHVLHYVGNVLFNLLMPSYLKRFVPFHDFLVYYQGNEIVVQLRSLATTKTCYGTSYFSPHKPTVTINGCECVVAFSKHATDNVYKRAQIPGPITYESIGDIFGLLYQTLYFEPVELPDKQFALSFFVRTEPGYMHNKIAAEITGQKKVSDSHFLRVGYLVGSEVEAKNGQRLYLASTLLYPGFRKTPEYAALKSANLPRPKITEMLRSARGLSLKSVSWDGTTKNDTVDGFRIVKMGSGDASILRWFHEHGVPQVVDLSGINAEAPWLYEA